MAKSEQLHTLQAGTILHRMNLLLHAETPVAAVSSYKVLSILIRSAFIAATDSANSYVFQEICLISTGTVWREGKL